MVYFNNDKLTSPTIHIGEKAFGDCINLTDVCLTNTPQTISFGEYCFDGDVKLNHLYNLDTVIDGGLQNYMFRNTNVQENRLNIFDPQALFDNTFVGIYHDWHLPNIHMSQVPMDTKWGLENGMKMYLSDGVITG